MKLHKGDEVIITRGKDKGKKGKIEKIVNGGKVVLPGLNLFKRHLKKKNDQTPGGIISFPRPLPVANVSFVCPKCGKSTRIGYIIQKGEKTRICKKCNAHI